MSKKREKSPVVRGPIDLPASTATVSEKGTNRQDLADEKITVEGEAEKVCEHKDKADTDNVGNPHADTDSQERQQIDTSSVTTADTHLNMTGGKQEVLGGSSNAESPCKCECGHMEAEHMPPDQLDRMCKHAECTCWNFNSVRMDDDTYMQEATQEGHRAAEVLKGEVVLFNESSLQETKTYTADVNSNGNPSDSKLSPNEEGQEQAIEEQVNDQVQVQNQGTEQIDVNENQNMTEQAEISACFDVALAKLKKVRTFVIKQKSQIIKELALDLKATGKIRSDSICIEIIERLRDKVSERLIRKCLDIEYKDQRQAKNAKKQQHKVAAKNAAKQEVIIDTSGHSTQQPNKPDSSDEASTDEAYKHSGKKPQPEESKWVVEQTGTDRKSPPEQLNESRFENSGRAYVNTSGQEMVDPTRTPKENPAKIQEIGGSGDNTDRSPSSQHVEWKECSLPFDDVWNVVSQAQSKDRDKFWLCMKLDRPATIVDIRLGRLNGGGVSHD